MNLSEKYPKLSEQTAQWIKTFIDANTECGDDINENILIALGSEFVVVLLDRSWGDDLQSRYELVKPNLNSVKQITDKYFYKANTYFIEAIIYKGENLDHDSDIYVYSDGRRHVKNVLTE